MRPPCFCVLLCVVSCHDAWGGLCKGGFCSSPVRGIAICLSVAAILLNPISEDGSLDRRIKRCESAQDAHNLSRAGSLNVEAKGIHRIRTSGDVRLLLRRMAVLDVAPDQVNSADPLLFRELQGRCSLCPSRATCACDLAPLTLNRAIGESTARMQPCSAS
jgi:hypothetical protein